MLKRLNRAIFGVKTRRGLQVDALDGIRGLAVLFVLFSHAAGMNLVLFPEIKFAGDGSGHQGVYLFFVLSAFLLTRGLMRQNVADIKSVRLWLDYFVRRFLRIFPLFTVLLITILIGWRTMIIRSFGSFTLADFWQHITLQTGRHHLWTIGIEVRYYLVLPIFIFGYFFMFKRNKGMATAVVIGILILGLMLFPAFPAEYENVKFLPLFLSGSYLAVVNEWYQNQQKKIPSGMLTVIGLSCLIVTLFLMPSTYSLFMGEKHHLINFRYYPFWGFLFGLLIFVVINENGLLSRVFAHKSMRFMGIISFSLYLWHYFILHWALNLGTPQTIKILAYYVGSILFSTFSFLLFEKPLFKIRINKNNAVVQAALQSASD